MLFKNIAILDENYEIKESRYVGTEKDKIAYIGTETPETDFGEVYDGKNKLLMPAFFNAHAHSPMMLMRGYGENLTLQDWLNTRIFPFEDKLTSEAVYYATLLAMAESLRFGIVSSSDMYYFCDDMVRAVEESGAKANISRSITSFAEGSVKNNDSYREAEALIRDYHGAAEGRILIDASIHAEYTNTVTSMTEVADLAKKYDLYVITDEVYEHILYKPHVHTYMASLPGMRERTIMCNSLSKTYSITGWRLGYVIAPPEIADRVKKVHDFLTVGAAAPLMEAAVVGLNFGDDYYQQLQAHYTHMKELFVGGLKDIGLTFTEPQGAYYVLMDISEFGYDSDLVFCEELAEKVGIGAVPGSSFFREDVNHLIRFHFAKQDETLKKALDRLADIRTKMKK